MFINGSILLPMLTVLNDNSPPTGEKHAVAGVAGGKDAIKHVRPQSCQLNQILGRAHTHYIAGFVVGQ